MDENVMGNFTADLVRALTDGGNTFKESSTSMLVLFGIVIFCLCIPEKHFVLKRIMQQGKVAFIFQGYI